MGQNDAVSSPIQNLPDAALREEKCTADAECKAIMPKLELVAVCRDLSGDAAAMLARAALMRVLVNILSIVFKNECEIERRLVILYKLLVFEATSPLFIQFLFFTRRPHHKSRFILTANVLSKSSCSCMGGHLNNWHCAELCRSMTINTGVYSLYSLYLGLDCARSGLVGRIRTAGPFYPASLKALASREILI